MEYYHDSGITDEFGSPAHGDVMVMRITERELVLEFFNSRIYLFIEGWILPGIFPKSLVKIR